MRLVLVGDPPLSRAGGQTLIVEGEPLGAAMDWLQAPDYWLARWVFERLLGAIYLLGFLAAAKQFPALLGEHGLLPAPRFLRMARRHSSARRVRGAANRAHRCRAVTPLVAQTSSAAEASALQAASRGPVRINFHLE